MPVKDIKSTVMLALAAHLAPSVLTDLRVYEETDADGEPILRFQAVVDSTGPGLTADTVFFATGVVRKALAEIDETRFPLLSFPSSDEIPGVAA
jgi:hypothetical protein